MMVLMCCELVIENELKHGCKQADVAMTYAMAIHSHDNGRLTDWRRINEAIEAKWGKRGVTRVKKLAWAIVERHQNAVS